MNNDNDVSHVGKGRSWVGGRSDERRGSSGCACAHLFLPILRELPPDLGKAEAVATPHEKEAEGMILIMCVNVIAFGVGVAVGYMWRMHINMGEW